MNVGELIRQLEQLPKDMEIYLCSDGEGNSMNEVDTVVVGQGEIDDELVEGVIFWPVS